MLWAIIRSFLSATGTICQKKATSFWVDPVVFLCFGYTSYMLFAIGAAAVGKLPPPGDFTLTTWWLVILVMSLKFTQRIFSVKAYSIEKVSCLQPFSNINKIIAILWWFFLLGEKWWAALLAALGSLAICIGYSFYKSHGHIRLQKWLFFMIISEFLTWLRVLFLTVLLASMVGYVYASYQWIAFFFVPLVFLCIKRRTHEFFWLPKGYYIPRITMAFTWLWGFLISLFLISSIGIVRTTLVSFVTLSVIFVFAQLFLHDKPSKADALVSFWTLFLASIGYLLD